MRHSSRPRRGAGPAGANVWWNTHSSRVTRRPPGPHRAGRGSAAAGPRDHDQAAGQAGQQRAQAWHAAACVRRNLATSNHSCRASRSARRPERVQLRRIHPYCGSLCGRHQRRLRSAISVFAATAMGLRSVACAMRASRAICYGSRRGDMSRLSRSWNGSLVPRLPSVISEKVAKYVFELKVCPSRLSESNR
jgi:hypothetical protein